MFLIRQFHEFTESNHNHFGKDFEFLKKKLIVVLYLVVNDLNADICNVTLRKILSKLVHILDIMVNSLIGTHEIKSAPNLNYCDPSH